jgi:succinoglycan biosynthesis protein ExoM
MTIAGEGTAMVEASLRDTVPAGQAHQITVCICTLRRPQLLSQTLAKLEGQKTDGLFTYSIVVADNDGLQSAQQAVAAFSSVTRLPVTYCVEPQQNIALARNKALQHAGGDLIAFIDDDEFPADDWLWNLFKAYKASGADGVLGPVKPYFETEPPRWVRKGGFFERPTHATGYEVGWEQSRTGNVLFRKDILSALETPFRSKFGTAGEDMDFFRRAIDKGCSFVWCNEAVAYEVVPSSRCTRSYLLKRALLRGSNFPKHPAHRVRNVLKSLIAVPCYLLILPVLVVLGQDVFLKYLIKLLDHTSRIFAFLGLSFVTQRQT